MTVDEIRAAERAAVAAGTSERQLMIAAGRGFAELLLSHCSVYPLNALFLIGPGNNGGDGLVAAARLVEEGCRCFIWAYRREGLAGAPVDDAEAASFVWIKNRSDLKRQMQEADVIIDAVFGLGGRADLPADVAGAFALAREARIERGTPLWALDLPSGVDADSGESSPNAFQADVTVMLGLPKIGLYRGEAANRAGELRLIDIGLPEAESRAGIQLVDEVAARRLLPRRPALTHKRQVGTLLIVGGAPTYYGAPRLAGAAALRVGAGLVTLAVSRSIVGSVAAALPEVTFLPLPDAEFGGAGRRMAELVTAAIDDYSALLIGPGIGRDDTVSEFLFELFGIRTAARTLGFGVARQGADQGKSFHARAVVDADALTWLATQEGWPERLADAELVLTPHPGELSRLLKVAVETITADPWAAAREAAERFKQVVVLKHGHPVVAAPDGTLSIGPAANPALASAGTGDVLAGIIAGLLAQGLSAHDAAVCGLYLGSEAARLAVEDLGTLSLIASDVVDALAPTLQRLYDPEW